MKKKIIISYKIPKEGLTDLFDRYEVLYPQSTMFDNKELLKIIPDYHALITVFGKKLNDDVIEKANNLKIISNYGVGFENINLETATRNKIVVTNTPDAVTEPTAEITMGLMISVMRRISECDTRLRNENNFEWGIMKNLGRILYGKTIGIIGMGKIGNAVAKRARAFGMDIKYFDHKQLNREQENQYSAQYVSLNELLKISDVISVHTPLNEQTFHLLGKNEFELMKSSAFLINTSRGPVVDEKVLVNYLQNNKIAGAGLDVYENEPAISKELLKMDNVVLSPHIGTGTIETRIDMAKSASKNIIDYFEGKIPEFIVNREVLKYMKL